MTSSTSTSSADGSPDRFATTRWSVVLAVRRRGAAEAQDALQTLCQTYWQPLYGYLRRQGCQASDAEDLVQGFFATLLERKDLQAARRERGKFRSFLLASLKHYLANERDRAAAQKRGGGRPPLSLDFAAAESRFLAEPMERRAPEDAFARQWALALLERVHQRLQTEMQQSGKSALYDGLRPYLTGEGAGASYAEAAIALEMSEGAVKTAVHRLRRRFGEVLREEIAHTVAAADAVDEEIRDLFEALRRPV